jgi:hypothetical protein
MHFESEVEWLTPLPLRVLWLPPSQPMLCLLCENVSYWIHFHMNSVLVLPKIHFQEVLGYVL